MLYTELIEFVSELVGLGDGERRAITALLNAARHIQRLNELHATSGLSDRQAEVREYWERTARHHARMLGKKAYRPIPAVGRYTCTPLTCQTRRLLWTWDTTV